MANLKSKVQTTGKLKGKARSQKEIVAQIRKRKGLPDVSPGLSEFLDKE